MKYIRFEKFLSYNQSNNHLSLYYRSFTGIHDRKRNASDENGAAETFILQIDNKTRSENERTILQGNSKYKY